MEESLNDIDEQDMLPVLDVRVLDATKKSKFRVRRLINFPLAETMDEMKSALKIFMPDIEHVENCDIGYVLERNKKYTIETNGELQDACQEFKKGFPNSNVARHIASKTSSVKEARWHER
jgi:hypothetical protein